QKAEVVARQHSPVRGDIVPPFVAANGWMLSGDNLGFLGGGIGDRGVAPPMPPPTYRWSEATAAFVADLAADAEGAVTTPVVAPARGGVYRVRVFASAPLPGGAPGLFGSADMWIDFR
ncbi:MAG TPA: hypothetical protein VN903_17270, partial [Polyangia bacterium]|nr:hypothetical protein [Polyangia bacterium]